MSERVITISPQQEQPKVAVANAADATSQLSVAGPVAQPSLSASGRTAKMIVSIAALATAALVMVAAVLTLRRACHMDSWRAGRGLRYHHADQYLAEPLQTVRAHSVEEFVDEPSPARSRLSLTADTVLDSEVHAL